MHGARDRKANELVQLLERTPRSAERNLKHIAGVKTLCVALFLCAACSAERDSAGTATIAPAEARPAPTATTTLVSVPAITTSGSPPPAVAAAPGSEAVVIRAGTIELRPLLPRGHTAFRIEDATGTSHQLVLRGSSGGSAATTVSADGAGLIQMNLVDPAYELVCTSEGHTERAQFKTYVPGVALRTRPN
jgi:hypothetical protein